MATDRTAARKRARPAPVEPQAPDLDVLEDACCPITLEVFRDPVTLAQSGITYERAALEDALARQPGVDPETRGPFRKRMASGPAPLCSPAASSTTSTSTARGQEAARGAARCLFASGKVLQVDTTKY